MCKTDLKVKSSNEWKYGQNKITMSRLARMPFIGSQTRKCRYELARLKHSSLEHFLNHSPDM